MYVALYVISHCTSETTGTHHANMYSYSDVGSFVGVAPLYVGVVPYSTRLSVSSIVPSSFSHIILYVFTLYV